MMPPDRRLFTTGVPPPYDEFLSLLAQRKELKEKAPRTLRPKNWGPLTRRSAQKVRPRHIPCAWGERGVSFPRHFVLGLRSPSSLGLSKGDPKQNQCTPTSVYMGVREVGLVFFLGAFRRAKCRIFPLPLWEGVRGRGLEWRHPRIGVVEGPDLTHVVHGLATPDVAVACAFVVLWF